MKEAVSFLFYDSTSNEWQSISCEELAALNDPNIAIIPIYEDGTQGDQTTWKIWDLSRQKAIIQREVEYMERKKMNISFPPAFSAASEQIPQEKAKEREMMELEHIDMLPPEVRAVDYLLRHTSLPNLIEEMRSLVKNASSLIAFIIFVNIFALAVGLIAIVVSIGR
jgi:hypothetical protein